MAQNNSNTNWLEAKEFIEETLNKASSFLEKKSLDFIQHYIDHDEYEMAFEILFLDLINSGIYIELDLTKSKIIGENLELNQESVFDPEFWGKFELYRLNSAKK